MVSFIESLLNAAIEPAWDVLFDRSSVIILLVSFVSELHISNSISQVSLQSWCSDRTRKDSTLQPATIVSSKQIKQTERSLWI